VIVDTQLPITIALAHEDLDRLALWCIILVIDVVEGARLALVEEHAVAEYQGAIGAMAEAGGEDRTSLWGVVELELGIGSDVSRAVLFIGQDTVLQLSQELASRVARSFESLVLDDVSVGKRFAIID